MHPSSPTIALIVGTRPEAIKMAPVHRALVAGGAVRPVLISSGQHRELLRGALAALELAADVDLDVMAASQTPNQVLARVVERLEPLFAELRPAAVLVQGDTTTVLAAALAAFHAHIPVGHVEAGLRTHDLENPFPEEANRQLVDRLAKWCFAPTQGSALHLRRESIPPEHVHVTGNTGVDSMLWASSRSSFRVAPNTLLLTLHRRESFGTAMESILRGIRDFLELTADARVVWPVHPNPNVAAAADRTLGDHPRVQRIEPLDYVTFAGALTSCRLVLTDSGGIQEEAPSLGKTVLVARDTTERPEAVEAGLNRIVGRSAQSVRDALSKAWEEPEYSGSLPAPNPYGDGRAGERIAKILTESLG